MKIPYGRQSIEEDDIQAVNDVLRSDYLTAGPATVKFEQIIGDYVGARYAVAVSNGTAALHISCLAVGIGPGDEVIVPAITFAASANCVLYCGGTPVFADIDPVTYNIDPLDVERKITARTKAIIPVHFTGQPCELDAIHEIARKRKLLVIEDAAHALGAEYKEQKIGALSDLTIFSFHPVKPITAGEGGMVTTNDKELYRRLMLFRSHGITREEEWMEPGTCSEGGWYYQMLELGFNYRLTDMQAALGISQMGKLERFLASRERIAQAYQDAFADIPKLILPSQLPEMKSGWHLYVVQTAADRRKEVFEALRHAGIGVNVHYIPVYHHPYYQRHGYDKTDCPQAERLYQRMISLPIYPGLSGGQQKYVIEQVRKLFCAGDDL